MKLRCAFGRPHPVDPTWSGEDHCRKCHAEVERGIRAIEREVFFGRLNARGYTEAEWKASGRSRETWRAAVEPTL